MPTDQRHYNGIAIALHWLIAVAIIANLLLGLWMSDAIDAPQMQSRAIAAYQWHKSLGLSILVLSLLRLVWRLLLPPPPLPVSMPAHERMVAALTHWAFYGFMIAVPLSGWFYVSAQWRDDAPLLIPTLWFGLFEVPHLFGLNSAGDALRAQTAEIAIEAHEWLTWSMLTLLVLHVAAALLHQFVRHDGVLARMWPGLLPAADDTVEQVPNSTAGALHYAAAAVVVLIAVAFTLYATSTTLVPQTRLADTGTDTRTDSGVQTTLREMIADAGQLPQWQVAQADSAIRFSGTHAGRPLKGNFKRWQAAIRFDPRLPDQSRIVALVETASASDSVPLHDKTLPQREWFDVARHPYATFRSTGLAQLGDNRYELEGTLTIKEHEVQLAPLTLTVDGAALRIQGEVEVDRAAVDMGMESDPEAQYVSRRITIVVDVAATNRE